MKKILVVVMLFLLAAINAQAEPVDIPEGLKCHLCGMKVDPASAFSSQIVDDGQMLPFCDIGDMLYHYNKQDEKPSELYVRDMKSQGWIVADKAVYVKSKSFDTPMGWGIAAFSEQEEAAKFGETMTFEEALNYIGGAKAKMKMHK